MKKYYFGNVDILMCTISKADFTNKDAYSLILYILDMVMPHTNPME